MRFPQRKFDTENLYTQQELVHTKAYTQRHASFNTETGKLVHRDGEAFTHYKLSHRASSLHRASFYTQKLLHTEAFTQRRFYTEKPLHSEDFTHSRLLHTEAFTSTFTHSKLSHKEAPTQKSLYTEKLLHI